VVVSFQFYTFDPTNNTISALDKPAPNNNHFTYQNNLIILPSGEMMYACMDFVLNIYTPAASAQPQNSWKPVIIDSPTTMATGRTYTISGTQLTGISRGASYGDDSQVATNYPVVRVTSFNPAVTRHVRTFNFPARGISKFGDNAVSSTSIQVPNDLPSGSYQLQVVAKGIVSNPVPVSIITKDCFFLVDCDAYAEGEVQADIKANGAPAKFEPAIYVNVEGFTVNELGLNDNNLGTPPHPPVIPSPLSAVSFELSGSVIPEDLSLPSRPQRFTFPFRVKFDNTTPFNFAGVDPKQMPIVASLTVANQSVLVATVLELLKTPDPYILHGDAVLGNPWYLSTDLRVVQILPNQTRFGANVGTGAAQGAATQYIQQVMAKPEQGFSGR
jgi:hypothetical protein